MSKLQYLFFHLFSLSVSFDCRNFSLKTKTILRYLFLLPFILQPYPVLVIYYCAVFKHPSSFMFCELFSSASSLFIPPSASSPPFHSLNHNIAQPTNKGSVIHLASLFSSTFLFSSISASPAGEQLCDFGPAVAQLLVRLVDDAVLLLSPRGLLHLRVQVVVPALAALLANSPLQVLGDHRPALGSILLHQLDHLGWPCLCVRGGEKEESQEGRRKSVEREEK